MRHSVSAIIWDLRLIPEPILQSRAGVCAAIFWPNASILGILRKLAESTQLSGQLAENSGIKGDGNERK
jgi:hypothetical protein